MVSMMSKPFHTNQAFHSGQTTAPELSIPPPEECPRCGSRNTKFCYYNNYNKSQPRHLCKSCKRHWTRGGALRSIPAARRRRSKRPRTHAPPQREHFLNSLSFSTDQSYTSDMLYQALARCASPQGTILESNGTTYAASSAATPHNHQNTEFISSSAFTCIPTSSNQYYSGENLASTTSAAPENPIAAAELWKWDINETEFLGEVWDDFYAYKL